MRLGHAFCSSLYAMQGSFYSKILLLVLTLFFASCQSAKQEPWDNSNIRWYSLPATFYVSKSLATNDKAMQDIQSAVDFWNEKAGKTVLKNLGPWDSDNNIYDGAIESPKSINANVLFTPGEWPMSSEIAGKTIMIKSSGYFKSAMIAINSSKSYCYGICDKAEEQNATSFRKLMAHELGHFLGLSHVNDPQNLLNPVLSPGGDISSTHIDENAFSKLTQ